MDDYPSWWSWRDRLAAHFGPLCWPAWYIAPRATRDRWSAAAQLSEDPEASLGEWIAFLHDYGIEVTKPPSYWSPPRDRHRCSCTSSLDCDGYSAGCPYRRSR